MAQTQVNFAVELGVEYKDNGTFKVVASGMGSIIASIDELNNKTKELGNNINETASWATTLEYGAQAIG